MNATGRTKRAPGGFRDARGYTIVEVMAAMGIAVIVGIGLYQVFTASQRSSSAQRLRNEVQSGCTFAMDQIKNELALGGYRAINPAQPISTAAPGSITFEYWDDRAVPLADHSNNTEVTFRRATTVETGGGPQGIKPGDLIRETRRYKTTAPAGFDTLTKQVLAENIPALSFTYLQSDNALWSGVNLGAIRTIRTALTCESGRVGPEMQQKIQITLTSEVRARNVGVSATPQDTSPPATPTGVVVWDEGDCGQLQVRWDGNTDPDLEGYIVLSGLGGNYTKRTRVTRAPKATTGLFEYHTLTGLTSAKTTDPVGNPTMYSVAVQAFDKAGNMSVAISTPASGNPTPSRRTEAEAAASGSDSTINPDLPPAPVLAATATPAADQSITLSWTPPAVGELAGYRLYRGVTATFVPNDTPGTGNRIADETRIGANAVSWVDDNSKPAPGGQLNGCQEYFYKICAVICDKTLVASYTAAQFTTASATPTDLEKPPAPSITPIPGYKRIILNLTNPVRTGMGSTPDFTYTKIYFSTVDWLTIVNDVVMDGAAPARAIPDNGGQFTADGASGGTINFDDELYATPAGGITNPNLLTDKTYYFLAVSYDQCNNHSEVANQAKASADQCSDCDAAQGCLDAPYAPPNLRVDTSSAGNGCYGALTLAWDYPDSYVSQHPDFKAFRVLRRQGDTFTSGINETVLSNVWLDKTFSDSSSSGLQDGVVYSYRVEAYDCYYFEWMMDNSYIQAGNPPGNNISSVMFPPGSGAFGTVDLNGVSLGRPLLEASRPVLTGSLAATPPSFHHNQVLFEIRNTSNAASSGRLRLDGMTATWDNPLAFLQRVDVGDDNTSPLTLAFDDGAAALTHGSLGSTVTFTTRPLLDALDTQIPFRALFMNADRSVDRDTDMRTNWIDYTLTYANPTTGATGCTSIDSIYTPLGPYVYSVSQDKPYLGTLGWPVLGESGTNFLNGVVVPGGSDVNVFAEILDGSGAGIAAGQVRLFYYLDATKVFTIAPAVTGTFPAGTNYTSVSMTKVAGDQWRATIPATSDTNVWYFVVATDSQGNFDVDPEPWAGAYQYYQQAPDNCATTPNPPASLTGTVSGGNVTLTWAGPTTNATPSGSTYTDRGGFKVYRDRNDGTGWQLHYAGTISNPAATTFTDSAVYNLDTFRYDYRITAFDLCTPTPNESDPSNSWTETVENVCSNTPNPPVLTGTSSDSGGSVTLTWTAPTENAPPSLAPLADLAGYQVWRQRETTSGGAEPWMLLATISSPATLTHTDYGPTSTGIRTNIFRYYVTAFDTCSPTRNVSAGSNVYTENENSIPCTSFPGPPTSLTGTATAAGVTLAWLAPTQNTDGTAYADAGGYRIGRSGDDGLTWQLIGTTDSATLSFADTSATLLADFGLLSRNYRYRVAAFDSCSVPNQSLPSNVYIETYVGDCGSVPNPPAILTGSGGSTSSAAGVTLKWTAPTTNASPAGQPYTDPGGYRVYRRKDGGAWTKVGPDLSAGTFSYTDTEIADTPTVYEIGNAVYSYYVSAIDTCTPPNESGASNLYDDTFTDACVGLSVPAAPGALTLTYQSDQSKSADLSWVAAAPAPDGYRVYGCSQADTGSAPTRTCTLVKINSPDPLTGTTFTHSLGNTKVNAIEWFYAVKSLNRGTCADSSKWVESAGYNTNGILADPYR